MKNVTLSIALLLFGMLLLGSLAYSADISSYKYTGPSKVEGPPPSVAFVVAGNIDHCLNNTNRSEDYCIEWAAERNNVSPQQAYNWYVQVQYYRFTH